MLEGKPLISIIIPVYNVEKEFPRCIESVVNQTYRELEIILVDDGSTDGSPALCDSYASSDVRIKCAHQKNSGVSRARNVGLQMAKGDYYHFLDSDDYLELDTYEYLLEQMDSAESEAASLEYFVTYPEYEVEHSFSRSHYGRKDTKDSLEEHLLIGNSFLCTKLLPSHAVRGLHFLENIYRDEDTLFGWQALSRVDSVVFCNRPLLHYVQSEDSACRGAFRTSQLSAIDAIPIWEEMLSEGYPDFVGRWRAGYMNLMVTLYCDMYLDSRPFHEEKAMVFETFHELRKKVPRGTIKSGKTKAKFALFGANPELFGAVHRMIHGL